LTLEKHLNLKSPGAPSVWKGEVFRNGYWWFLEKISSIMYLKIDAAIWGIAVLTRFPEPQQFSVAV